MNAQLLTIHMEHGLPLLSGLDLATLLGAKDRMEAGDTSVFPEVLKSLGGAGELRVMRKLSAVVQATAEELLAAELDPKKLQAMESAAALRPFGETFQDAMGFFSAWAASLGAPLGSSGTEETSRTAAQPLGGVSPSAGS